MLSKILIIGGKGNMGRRYQAVLDTLRVEYRIFDVPPMNTYYNSYYDMEFNLAWCDGIMICTPTRTHFEVFCEILKRDPLHKPILCEKPFSKDLTEVEKACEMAAKDRRPFQMVNQYEHLDSLAPVALRQPYTCYDYYHSGGDGIYWDCLNIIGLDKTGNITLKNKSPIWTCMINGLRVNRADIDSSYVMMVKKWLEKPTTNATYMVEAHKKTLALIAASQK